MLHLFINKLYLRHEKPIILVINNSALKNLFSYFVPKQPVCISVVINIEKIIFLSNFMRLLTKDIL